MAKFTSEQKVEWAKDKKSEMELTVGKFLNEALQTKEGIENLTNHYRVLLPEAMQDIKRYSTYNQSLIYSQKGSVCFSKSNWAIGDRKVTDFKSKYIYILRPLLIDEKVKGVKTGDKTCIGFTPCRTWDITQTDGEPLEYAHNSSDDLTVEYDRVAKVMAELAECEVVEKFTGSARGWSDGKQLTVSEMSNDTDKAKTLIHEAVHHMLHTGKSADVKVSYATGEVEAESTAYLVMSFLGLDFELSKSYVNSYKAGIQDARVKLICDTADKMIKALKAEFTDAELFLANV